MRLNHIHDWALPSGNGEGRLCFKCGAILFKDAYQVSRTLANKIWNSFLERRRANGKSWRSFNG